MPFLIVDLVKDPMHSSFYHSGYDGRIRGMPLNWHDDVTGFLPAAVKSFFEDRIADHQLELVIAYVKHHIHAPIWLEYWPFEDDDEDRKNSIRNLRKMSLELKTSLDVKRYIQAALNVGVDPL